MNPDRDAISEVDSTLHSSSHVVSEGPSRPTDGQVWTQVENQSAADQSEGEARRDERDQRGGREAHEDNE